MNFVNAEFFTESDLSGPLMAEILEVVSILKYGI